MEMCVSVWTNEAHHQCVVYLIEKKNMDKTERKEKTTEMKKNASTSRWKRQNYEIWCANGMYTTIFGDTTNTHKMIIFFFPFFWWFFAFCFFFFLLFFTLKNLCTIWTEKDNNNNNRHNTKIFRFDLYTLKRRIKISAIRDTRHTQQQWCKYKNLKLGSAAFARVLRTRWQIYFSVNANANGQFHAPQCVSAPLMYNFVHGVHCTYVSLGVG